MARCGDPMIRFVHPISIKLIKQRYALATVIIACGWNARGQRGEHIKILHT